MARENILIVEDEEDILELLRYNLAKESYQIACVASGEDAIKAAKAQVPDLILLDLMLPGMDGLEVCKVLRTASATARIPVIMITAKGEDADVVTGLELGADDYVTKPFSPRILLSRVKAVLRRSKVTPVSESEVIEVDDLAIHPGRHEVLVKGKSVDLTLTEFRILQLLAGRRGWVFTRNQLVEGVRKENYSVTDRVIDFQIVGLRKKLGPCSKYIETVRGVGYRFKE